VFYEVKILEGTTLAQKIRQACMFSISFLNTVKFWFIKKYLFSANGILKVELLHSVQIVRERNCLDSFILTSDILEFSRIQIRS
jgi:hypothetical protein